MLPIRPMKITPRSFSLNQLHQNLTQSLSSTSPSLLTPNEPSGQSPSKSSVKEGESSNSENSEPSNSKEPKSVSEADAELRERMEQMSGEGGASGVEYEDGKPNTMKRGVRNNMFRVI